MKEILRKLIFVETSDSKIFGNLILWIKFLQDFKTE